MSIVFRCICGRQLTAPESGLIRRIKCPSCGTFAAVPLGGSTVPLGGSTVEALDDGVKRVVLDPKTAEEKAEEPAKPPGPEQVRCDLTVDYGQYVRCFPVQPIAFAILTIGFLLIAALSRSLLLVLLALGVAALNALCWMRAKALGKMCILCPGQVIDDQPYRVAIYANLSQGEGYWPVLKIVEQPLEKMHGGPPKVGDLLAMAGALQPDPDTDEHARDLDAVAIPCLTRDPTTIQKHLDLVPKGQWILLKSALAKRKKLATKLYHLRSPGAGWAEAMPKKSQVHWQGEKEATDEEDD